ncbi:MAG: hypothetical protein KF725_08950 [Cyclobacteriaceae bacterium]|nr:hypothetical protein [Cyclobacteriaceae bacterium]UYN88073.1 MAG: hypothetical protein KIT51_07450 [Cyclobacteriaceae bacterium]
MNTKTIFFTVLTSTLASVAFAQEEKPNIKLTKTEKIWIAAYDDTTKALATLFLNKRHQIRKEQETGYYVLGASVVVLGTGLMLSSHNSPTGSGVAIEQDMDMSFVPLLLGFSGVMWSGITLGGNALMLHPYTVKKYNKLVGLHAAGQPLPRFYTKRLTPFLR